MQADLRALLLAAGGVPAIVAWGERPQAAALPCVVLTRASAVPEYTQDGDSGMTATRVQADCWAATYAAAHGAGAAVIAALSGYRGTVGATRFNGVFTDSVRDTREAETDGADRFFRVSIDFIVNHTAET